MNLYDKASLIITPNAYKVGKIYAAKPTSGAGDLTFARASAQTRRNSAGVIENLANNVPALDYPTVGDCPWWNFPVQRTNLALRSEEFDNASWSKVASSVIANSSISPSGLQDADTISGNGASGAHYIQQSFTTVSGSLHAISVFAKKNTNDFIQINITGAAFGGDAWANFNLNTGSVGSVGSGSTALIQDVGNGWYRCILIRTANNSLGAPFYVMLVTGANSVGFESNTLNTSVFLWGAQIEVGNYASPYIRTEGSAITRVIANPNRSGLTSFIGQTEGGWYTEFRTGAVVPAAGDVVSINNSTPNTIAYNISGGVLRVSIFPSAGVIHIFGPAIVANTTYKCAVRYVSGNLVLYVNGTPYTSTSAYTMSGALNSLNYTSGVYGGERYPLLFGTNIFFLTPPSNAELLAYTS